MGRRAAFCVAALVAMLFVAGCGVEDSSQYPPGSSDAGGSAVVADPSLSQKAQAGEAAFNANCAICHGANAGGGTNLGPPLVHQIYEPGHHQDFAFYNAVRQGVQAHHWQFGNMPPAPGVSDDDIERITCYVRELQRAQGIFDDERGLAACRS